MFHQLTPAGRRQPENLRLLRATGVGLGIAAADAAISAWVAIS
jgi:hypothetical protein